MPFYARFIESSNAGNPINKREQANIRPERKLISMLPIAAVSLISLFDFAGAADAEYAAANRHFNRARAETLPDDPPAPLEETVAWLKNVPPFVGLHAPVGRNPDRTEIIASGIVSFMKAEENRHQPRPRLPALHVQLRLAGGNRQSAGISQ